MSKEELKKELEQIDYSDEENKLEAAVEMDKLLSTNKSFYVDGIGNLKVKKPSFSTQAEIEKFRAKKKFEVMRDNPDLPTKKQLFKLLKERGEWTDEDQEKHDALVLEIKNLKEEYREITSPSKKRNKKKEDAILEEILKLAKEKDSLAQIYMGYMQETVDGFVNNLCNYYSIYLCLELEDGNNVWPTFGEMMSSLDQESLNLIFSNVVDYWVNARDDFLDIQPDKQTGG